ncbi:MAG: hypothetical protein U5R49_12190 [Deltaproteobacteria bacterium]|nr:hypothetical protein [Deltaproteobacteria bacterium]
MDTSKIDIPQLRGSVKSFLRVPLVYPDPTETGPSEYTPNQFIRRVSLYRAFDKDEAGYVVVFETVDRPEEDTDHYKPFMDLLGRLEPGEVGSMQRVNLDKAFSEALGTWMPWVTATGAELPGELVSDDPPEILYHSATGPEQEAPVVHDWVACGQLLYSGLKGFELFRLFQEGRLHPHHPDNGLKIINPDTIERKPIELYEEVLHEVKEQVTKENIMVVCGDQKRKPTEKEIENIARRKYEQLPKVIPVIPEGCFAKTFTLS